MVTQLRQRIRDERGQAEAKARAQASREAALREVAELEARLKAARARARGASPANTLAKPTATSSDSAGDGVCPTCGRDGLKNVGAHRSRAHGYKAA